MLYTGQDAGRGAGALGGSSWVSYLELPRQIHRASLSQVPMVSGFFWRDISAGPPGGLS